MYTIGTMIKAIVKFQYHTFIQIYISLTNFFDDGTAIPRIDEVKYSDTIAHAQVTDVSAAERTFTIVYQPRFAFAHIVGRLTASCNFITLHGPPACHCATVRSSKPKASTMGQASE
jgi:hypothetical protein